MGFGWMFLGMFFLLPAVPEFLIGGGEQAGTMHLILVLLTGSLKAIPGFILVLKGTGEAYKHCRCFDLTKRMSAFGIFIAGIYFASEIGAETRLIDLPDVFRHVLCEAYAVFLAAFFLCYMRSILSVATETGVEKIRRRGAVGVILTFAFMLLGHLLERSYVYMASEVTYWLSVVGFAAETVFILYSMYVTFSCYMWICLEGDEDMPDNRKYKYVTPMDFYDKNKRNGGGKRK